MARKFAYRLLDAEASDGGWLIGAQSLVDLGAMLGGCLLADESGIWAEGAYYVACKDGLAKSHWSGEELAALLEASRDGDSPPDLGAFAADFASHCEGKPMENCKLTLAVCLARLRQE